MAFERLGIFEELQERRQKFSRFMRVAPSANFNPPAPVVRRNKSMRAILGRQPKAIQEEMTALGKVITGPQLKAVFDAIERTTGVSYSLLWSPSRSKPLADPRQFAMWVIWGLRHDLSLPAIGYVFDRDHTTIMHGVRKLQEQKETAPFYGWRCHPEMATFMAQWRARPMKGDAQP